MLEADTPPDDAREAMAADDDEKFRNIARIESALEIFGVLKIELYNQTVNLLFHYLFLKAGCSIKYFLW